MSIITISGASDDLIEVNGDIREEFYLNNHANNDGDLIACSDGTILRVGFSDQGVWRITTVARGSAKLVIDQATEDDEDGTDVATLDGEIVWVVHGIGWVGAK